MNDDGAERARMGVIVPARPKGARGEHLDELLGKRAEAKAQEAQRLSFMLEEPVIVDPAEEAKAVEAQQVAPNQPWIKPADDSNAFHSFQLIFKTLQKYPQQTQREMLELLSTLLLR